MILLKEIHNLIWVLKQNPCRLILLLIAFSEELLFKYIQQQYICAKETTDGV